MTQLDGVRYGIVGNAGRRQHSGRWTPGTYYDV